MSLSFKEKSYLFLQYMLAAVGTIYIYSLRSRKNAILGLMCCPQKNATLALRVLISSGYVRIAFFTGRREHL